MWQKSFVCSILIAASAFAQEPSPGRPMFILSAYVNPDNTLSIIGQNFGNGLPVVSVDATVLTVLTSSNTQILAQLPPSLWTGLHMLAVSPDSESTEFALFNLWINPDKPDGPQDTPGPGELRNGD